MILLSMAFANDGPAGTAHAVLANRFDADGVGHAAAVTEAIVVGGDGGTIGTTVIAKVGTKHFVGSVNVPFASYRTPERRSTALGNLRAEGFWRNANQHSVTLLGLELHLPTGNAWTWTNDATSYWRSGGVTAVFQRRQLIRPQLHALIRGALGLHRTPGFAPFPRTYPHVSMAAGVDHSISTVFGYTAELAISAWDPSPFDLGAWARLEPLKGFQVRLGGILPFGTWLGAAPSSKPNGLREMTVRLSISVSP